MLDEAALQSALDADPDATLSLLAEMTAATDVHLRLLARRFAAQFAIDHGRRREPHLRGVGKVVTRRLRDDVGDLDVERSLDALIDAAARSGPVDADELWVRRWGRPVTAFCLVVDRSGSMHGRPLATAALAAGAVAIRAAERPYAVLSFGRDVVAPKAMWEARSVDAVVDRMLALRGHGTTDVARALLAAREQLCAGPAGRRLTILLSDCRATEPGDVVGAASALDELVILAPQGDDDDARALADAVGAPLATYDGPSSVVTALSSVLDRRG